MRPADDWRPTDNAIGSCPTADRPACVRRTRNYATAELPTITATRSVADALAEVHYVFSKFGDILEIVDESAGSFSGAL